MHPNQTPTCWFRDLQHSAPAGGRIKRERSATPETQKQGTDILVIRILNHSLSPSLPCLRWFNGLFLASVLLTMLLFYGQYQSMRYDPLDALPTHVRSNGMSGSSIYKRSNGH